MTDSGKTAAEIFGKLKNDYEFRTLAASVFSALVTFVFAGYNVVLGVLHGTVWNVCIAVYYFLLVFMKFTMAWAEKRYHDAGLTEDERRNRREKFLLWQSVMLFVIDLSLLAPVVMMIKSERVVDYSSVAAIAMATYTVYKTVAASLNYSKTRKSLNLGVRIIRDVYFKDALVSVISLQYVMINTFGDGVNGVMLTVSEVTGSLLWLLIVTVSAFSMVQAIRLRKSRKNSASSEE